MARKEKELHLQLYPGWSARDNYAVHTKKKRKKKDMPGGEKGIYNNVVNTSILCELALYICSMAFKKNNALFMFF
jgi:hypothetical protein